MNYTVEKYTFIPRAIGMQERPYRWSDSGKALVRWAIFDIDDLVPGFAPLEDGVTSLEDDDKDLGRLASALLAGRGGSYGCAEAAELGQLLTGWSQSEERRESWALAKVGRFRVLVTQWNPCPDIYETHPSVADVRAMPAFLRHFTAGERQRLVWAVTAQHSDGRSGQSDYWTTALVAYLDGEPRRGYYLSYDRKRIKSGTWAGIPNGRTCMRLRKAT